MTTTAPAAEPQTLAIIGGAGHAAAQRFHAGLLAGMLDRAPIAGDTDLLDVVHLGYGLGGADGHFSATQTREWAARNARVLTAVAPTLVVAVCNTVQPALHAAVGDRWPVLDNLTVLRTAVATQPAEATAVGWIWLASHGAYAQDLFPYPGDTLADLTEDMILAGMNDSPDPEHVHRLADLLDTHATDTPTGVVLACTDLTGYAPLLRQCDLTVVDAVEELVAATLAHPLTLTTLTSPARPAPTTKEALR